MPSPFVAHIDLYPFKAFDTLAVETALVLASGALAGDRRWAFVDAQDRFVNGKLYPEVHRIRATAAPIGGTVTVDGQAFSLDRDVAALEGWMSRRLGTAVRLRDNPLAGFPDDADAPGPTVI